MSIESPIVTIVSTALGWCTFVKLLDLLEQTIMQNQFLFFRNQKYHCMI